MVSVGVEWGRGWKRRDMVGDPVVLRGVKSGLGGHDAGASVVDEGVENASLQLSEWRRLALSESPTFSGFTDMFKKS